MDGTWCKARRSYQNGNCVEVRMAPDGHVEVRDSADPSGPSLRFGAAQFAGFTAGVARREFDLS